MECFTRRLAFPNGRQVKPKRRVAAATYTTIALERKLVRLMTIGCSIGGQTDSLGLLSASHARANRYRRNAKLYYRLDGTDPYKCSHDRDDPGLIPIDPAADLPQATKKNK